MVMDEFWKIQRIINEFLLPPCAIRCAQIHIYLYNLNQFVSDDSVFGLVDPLNPRHEFSHEQHTRLRTVATP